VVGRLDWGLSNVFLGDLHVMFTSMTNKFQVIMGSCARHGADIVVLVGMGGEYVMTRHPP
jgi:hypothetical protein